MNYQKGVGLFEVLIALAILSFGVLGLISLQANLLRFGSQAQDRVRATLLAQNLMGLISVDSANVNCYALQTTAPAACTSTASSDQATAWSTAAKAALPNAGNPNVTIASDGQVTITLTWRGLTDSANRNLVVVGRPLP